MPGTRRVRIRVAGTVQGVGFRPFVYRAALEHGLAGFVMNDEQGVVVEAEGRLGPRRGARCACSSTERHHSRPSIPSAPRPSTPRGESEFRILPSEIARRARCAGLRRHGDLRSVPCGARRSGRPPLPLPLHQLHGLRPALHDRQGRPLRPTAHDDGGLSDVSSVPSRVRRPARPPLPCPAERVPRMRPAGTACTPRTAMEIEGDGDAITRAAAMLAKGAILAVKGIGGYHLACDARPSARSRLSASASAGRRSRLP